MELEGSRSYFLMPYDTQVDYWVANNLRWGDIKSLADSMYMSTIGRLRFDDGSNVTVDDCIVYTDLPDDAELYFVLEPAFYHV